MGLIRLGDRQSESVGVDAQTAGEGVRPGVAPTVEERADILIEARKDRRRLIGKIERCEQQQQKHGAHS
jgi:hypothetical protein